MKRPLSGTPATKMSPRAIALLPPKPNRLTPIVVYGFHEVRPEDDFDQTLGHDWITGNGLREERNVELKRMLLQGHAVAYRSSVNSLLPMVASGDRCTYTVVTLAEQVLVNDVVFCEVQEGDRFYAHLVSKKEYHHRDKCYYFTISNMKHVLDPISNPWTNGWCQMKHIHGKLILIQR